MPGKPSGARLLPKRLKNPLFLACLAHAGLGYAQAPAGTEPTETTEPASAARLIREAALSYPPEALAERLSGTVTVCVTVGVDGSVSAVTFEAGGPEVFVDSALTAAQSLQFEPARVGERPVVSQVHATFRFEPPVEEGIADPNDYTEVIVVARSPAAEETHSVVILDEAVLDRGAGQDLGEALSQVPGVAAARGTASSTKPIIRGQYERRLLLLFDGVRHESQKWGLDHAPEIDPFAAGSIQVIKGAAGVRYGPDAIGGVVLVAPPPLRDTPGVGAKVQLVGTTNAPGGVAAARLDGAFARWPGLAWRLEGNYGRAGAASAPDYVLGNTGSEEWNGGGTVGWRRGDVAIDASFHHYDFRGGVCYCVKNSTPDDFLGQLEADTPLGAEAWTPTLEIDRPFQAVTHDVALLRAVVARPGGGLLKATYAYQVNLRQEFEQARASITGPQYDFTLRTHSLDLFAGHGGLPVGADGRLEGGGGVSGTFQENVYGGLPLLPNYRGFQGGLYAFERLSGRHAAVELGGRYDHLSRAAFLTTSAFDRSVARGTLDEGDCDLTESSARCPRAFDAASVSLGGVWHALADTLDARLDLSSASRFPNADELYLNGSAPTAPVYALGDPGLGVETTWGASPTLGVTVPWLEAEASTYANYIDDYVYFAPELGPDGTPAFDVTIQGAFPRFSFRAIDALFYGVDGGLTLGPDAPVALIAQGSVVRAIDATTQRRLVMIPSDRLQVTTRASRPRLGALHSPYAEASGLVVFEQTQYDPNADLAPPPDGYFLLGAALGGEFDFRHDRALKIGLEATNLLNASYRDYTSLLRYYADEPGRSFRMRLGFTV